MERFRLASLIYKRVKRVWPDSSEAVIAERERIFINGILHGQIESKLSKLIDEACSSDLAEPLILVPVSGRYLDLFELWRNQVDLHVQGRLFVLALDGQALDTLRQDDRLITIDLSCYFEFDPNGVAERYSKRHLWILRVYVLNALVARGFTVISLDLDAIPVGNLNKMIDRLPAADIFAQQDYSIPMDVARRYGFIVCCGFMLIKPTPATVSFLREYVHQTFVELDDQTALNHLLARRGISNLVSTSLCSRFDSLGVSWVCPAKGMVSRDVKYGSVLRHFIQRGESVAALKMQLGIDTATN